MRFNEFSTKKKAIVLVSIILPIVIILSVLATFLGIYVVEGEKIKSISVSREPYKVSYYVGEEADYTGFELQVTKNNNEIYFVDHTECVFEGFDSSVVNERLTINVQYQEFETYFYVEIKSRPTTIGLLENIYINPLPKTLYKVGDPLNTEGGAIVKVYNNGTESRVDLLNKYVYNFDSSVPGEFDLLVKYIENGIFATTSYTITVTE